MKKICGVLVLAMFMSFAFTGQSMAMGLFKKKKSGNGGSGSPTGNFSSNYLGNGNPGQNNFGGLNSTVLPENPLNVDTILDEVKHPKFTPPTDGGNNGFENVPETPLNGALPTDSNGKPYAVPEPMTMTLMGMGLGGMLLRNRLKK